MSDDRLQTIRRTLEVYKKRGRDRALVKDVEYLLSHIDALEADVKALFSELKETIRDDSAVR